MSRSFRNTSRSFSNQENRRKDQRDGSRGNISQVETSQDQFGNGEGSRREKSLERNAGDFNSYKNFNDSHVREFYSHFRTHTPMKFDNSHSSTTRQSSYTRNYSSPFNRTFKYNFPAKYSFSNKTKPTTYTSFCPFPPPPSLEQKSLIVIQQDSTKKITQIMEQINSLDYSSNYWQLKSKFLFHCNRHIRFVGKLPQSTDILGDELLKDGLFHCRWVSVMKTQKSAQLESLLESYYVLYRDKVKINVEEFEKTLKPENCPIAPSSQLTQQEPQKTANLQLKRYRSLIDQQQAFRPASGSSTSTTSTTKLDIMILFQQLKQELHIEEIEKNIQQNVRNTIEKWKQQTSLLQKKNHQNFLPICDTDLMFESQQSILSKWNDQEELQKRKQAIEQLQKQRIRERSPLSNRFRMMHECQTNGRRMQVQMACMFLNIQTFHYLQDLEILSVEEIIFSENQQIVVLKAYTVEYDPKVGMMKIQPRVKTLISCYKFCGLSELIRLEKTYGRFEGIVVYPESFNIQKYLTNNKELSLVNDKYLSDIKTQVQSSQQSENQAVTSGEKIDY